MALELELLQSQLQLQLVPSCLRGRLQDVSNGKLMDKDAT